MTRLASYEPIAAQSKNPPIAFIFGAHGEEVRGTFRRIHPAQANVFFDYKTGELPDVPNQVWQPPIMDKLLSGGEVKLFTYGIRQPNGLEEFAAKNNLSLTRFEDSFIRCNGIGSTQLPYSWVFDDSGGIFFNAQRASGLEIALEYGANPDQRLDEARQVMQALIDNNLTKYNHGEPVNLEKVYGPKDKKRVLVLGQVPDDQSIKLGCANPMSNNDLVRMAHEENPDCQILYRPHPYVLNGLKDGREDPQDVAGIATVITQSMDFPTALQTIDHVYVQSSLSGFEARFRGIPVTATGCPFFSGWRTPGIDSRQPCARRTQTRTVEQIFAAAYLGYSRYFNPHTGEPMTAMGVIHELLRQRQRIAA